MKNEPWILKAQEMEESGNVATLWAVLREIFLALWKACDEQKHSRKEEP